MRIKNIKNEDLTITNNGTINNCSGYSTSVNMNGQVTIKFN